MPDLPRTQVPRVEIRARLTKDLYDRLQEECSHCGCALNAIITLAIAREVQLRRRRRMDVKEFSKEAAQNWDAREPNA